MQTNWHETIPHANPTVFQEMKWDAHVFGRQAFASNYARGGAASVMFGHDQSLGQSLKGAFGFGRVQEGSAQHIQNMRKLQSLTRDSAEAARLGEKIEKIEKAGLKGKGVGGKLMGGAMMGAMIAYPALTTEGPISEKAREATVGAAGLVGWEVGSKVGLALGSYFGGPLGGAIGYIAGGLTGDMTGSGIARAATHFTDHMAGRQSKSRKLNWANSNAAFSTHKAYTMRQHSMMAMNRGHMSARSLLGQEAVFLHQ